MIGLATAATIIASQSIISVAFSLTRQAIELGYLPTMRVVQTSPGQFGQIYVPAINWFMMVVTLLFVVGFGSSESLGGAFGMAVSTTMLITTLMLFVVMIDRWSWPAPVALAVALPFFVLDAAYVAGNSLKIASGGWAPLLVAAIACWLMTLWRTGEGVLHDMVREQTVSLRSFTAGLKQSSMPRVPGTGVFLSRTGEMPPVVLTRAVDKLGTLHERAVLVIIVHEKVPRVAAAQRVGVEDLGDGLYLVQLRYGFMQVPDIPRALRAAKLGGEPIDPEDVTYFILHHLTLVSKRAGWRAWRQRLFTTLDRNFEGAQHDNVPAKQVFTVGIPLYLPWKVSQTRRLKADAAARGAS